MDCKLLTMWSLWGEFGNRYFTQVKKVNVNELSKTL